VKYRDNSCMSSDVQIVVDAIEIELMVDAENSALGMDG